MGQRRKNDDGARKFWTIMQIMKQKAKRKGAIFPKFLWLMSCFRVLLLFLLEQPGGQSG